MGRGRLQTPSVKSPRDNGRGSTPAELVFPGRIRRLPEAHGRPYMPPSDLNVSDSPGRKSYANANGSMHQPPSDQVPEIGSLRQGLWLGGPSRPRSSNANPSASGTQRPRPSNGLSQDRYEIYNFFWVT